MLTLFVGESRGHVSITDERDCLHPDTIRTENRIFVDDAHVRQIAESYLKRGFKVSVQYGDHEYFTADIAGF